jgi:hypothetical protein
MIRLLVLVLLAAGAVRGQEDTNAVIFIPFAGTNDLSTEWWTTSDTNATGIAPWKAWWAADVNFQRLKRQVDALTNAPSSGGATPTNAMLNSFRAPAWTANSISLAAGASNAPVWVTNLAQVDYTVTLGSPQLYFSFDGTNYVSGSRTLITNVPVKVVFFSGLGIDTNSMSPTEIPMPAAVTNVTYWALTRPDLFGVTNAFYGEKVFVSEPASPSEAASKNYVDSSFAGTSWWSAKNDVQLNSYTLNFSVAWSEFVSGNQGTALHMDFLGQDAFTISYTAYTQPTNLVTASIDGTGTNVLVSLPTNGVSSSARLLLSHYLTPLNWQLCSSPPVLSGGAWVFTIPFPWPDSGFMISSIPSPNPGVMTLSTLLQMTPRTITNSTDTTWGYGAGLVVADTNYVNFSVGTNRWKRAALTSW